MTALPLAPPAIHRPTAQLSGPKSAAQVPLAPRVSLPPPTAAPSCPLPPTPAMLPTPSAPPLRAARPAAQTAVAEPRGRPTATGGPTAEQTFCLAQARLLAERLTQDKQLCAQLCACAEGQCDELAAWFSQERLSATKPQMTLEECQKAVAQLRSRARDLAGVLQASINTDGMLLTIATSLRLQISIANAVAIRWADAVGSIESATKSEVLALLRALPEADLAQIEQAARANLAAAEHCYVRLTTLRNSLCVTSAAGDDEPLPGAEAALPGGAEGVLAACERASALPRHIARGIERLVAERALRDERAPGREESKRVLEGIALQLKEVRLLDQLRQAILSVR